MRKTRRDAIATIEFNLQKYFVAKQQKYLIARLAIRRYTTKRFCLKVDTQQ